MKASTYEDLHVRNNVIRELIQLRFLLASYYASKHENMYKGTYQITTNRKIIFTENDKLLLMRY